LVKPENSVPGALEYEEMTADEAVDRARTILVGHVGLTLGLGGYTESQQEML
jgi:hypothetical protein